VRRPGPVNELARTLHAVHLLVGGAFKPDSDKNTKMIEELHRERVSQLIIQPVTPTSTGLASLDRHAF
jgi:hypothetical protein